MSAEENNDSTDVNFLGVKKNLKMPEVKDMGSQQNLVTSSDLGDDSNIVILEESLDPHSTTEILNVCKKKLLKPYMKFLGVMGLRPILEDSRESHVIVEILNVGYNLQVILFLVIGYFLQYVACFRRDRGFGRMPMARSLNRTELNAIYEKTCSESVVSIFIIPCLLHFVGYLYALLIFRRKDNEDLPVLIERVFLTSSHVPNMQENQRRIVKTLWVFIIGSVLWMVTSITLVNYLMAEGDITFQLLENSSYGIHLTLKILLIICIIWHDIVQASVIFNYCLQVQLLKSYVQFLKQKLLQQPVRPLDWIRDLEEFKKLVSYLNNKIAPPVCILTLKNWTYGISGTLWLLVPTNEVSGDGRSLSTAVNILNVILWWFIAVVPFIQAALLTSACDKIKTIGQEARTRPLVHQDTPLYELNSILIYTSSLNINARLFNLPISKKYTGITFAVVAVFLLVLGQCNYLHL